MRLLSFIKQGVYSSQPQRGYDLDFTEGRHWLLAETGSVGQSPCTVSSSEQMDTLPLPLSPYLTQRPSDLSNILAGRDRDNEDCRDKGLKVGKFLPPQKTKMGWYKVPRANFDYRYVPASLNPLLADLGVKEAEYAKIPTSQVIRFERDAQTMSLIGSFLDMMGASSGRIIEEALKNESLPQEAKDA